MLMTYIGALKAAIYAPILLLAGSGHLTLQVPVLGFGAVSIGLFFLALRRLTDTRVAILASLLLATDAVYLLTCVFDWGPVALQHLLVTAAPYALVRFGQEGRGALAVCGGAVCGLGALGQSAVRVAAGWIFGGCSRGLSSLVVADGAEASSGNCMRSGIRAGLRTVSVLQRYAWLAHFCSECASGTGGCHE